MTSITPFTVYLEAKYKEDFDNEVDKAYVMQCRYDTARALLQPHMRKSDKYPTYYQFKESIKRRIEPDDGVNLNDVFDDELTKLVEAEKQAALSENQA